MAGPSSRPCDCGSGEYPTPEVDGYGIFLFYACSQCEKKKLSKYRPDIKQRYQCDEPIDED
jgi:hypothetical protein